MIKTLTGFHLRTPLLTKLRITCCVAAVSLMFFSGASSAVALSYSQGASAAANSLTATVAMVDTKARSLEIITGVGHAVAPLQLEVPQTCRITVGGATRQLGDLKRGDIVRIQYRNIGQRHVADNVAIATIQPAPRGQNR